MAEINAEGQVTIDGNYVGELKGFKFALDPKAAGEEAKTIAQAAKEALKPVFHLRTENFYNTSDATITFNDTGTIFWENTPIGALKKGSAVFEPEISTFTDEDMPSELREKVERRLSHWFTRKRDELFAPLMAIKNDESLTGLTKGVGFQLVENFGIIPRDQIAKDVKSLSQDDRAFLRKHGVRFGQYTLFVPALLKPAPTELRLLLSAIWHQTDPITPPPAGLVTIPKNPDYKPSDYSMAGYHLAGERAIRVDMLERLADLLRDQPREGFEATPDMLSITGLSLEDLANLLTHLGYAAQKAERQRAKPTKEETEAAEAQGVEPVAGQEVYYTFTWQPRSNSKGHNSAQRKNKSFNKKPKQETRRKPRMAEKKVDPDSPFAALAALKSNN